MKTQLKYVNFYKRSLQKGYLDGFVADEELNITLSIDRDVACYVTPFFDTYDEDMTYNRLVIEGEFENLRLEVVVAATDELQHYHNNKLYNLDELLRGDEVSAYEKGQILCALPHVRRVDTTDIILHSLKGRYVFVYVAAVLKSDAFALIKGLRLEFPKYTFSDYLPEIYQGDDFFDRYLAVMQSKYLDIEREIDRLPDALDYEKADRESVLRLASWLGVEEYAKYLNTEQMRYMIKNIDLFQGGKGTRKTLEELIFLVCGIRPHIVENFQWSRYPTNAATKKLNMELYGDTRNHFAVILNLSQRTEPLPISERELEKLIENYSGIGTRFKLVCLRKAYHTDTYCYTDVNCFLSTPQTAAVDNISLGGYVVVG